ncbi:PocR ligand-binding domain-containing protein [uncultured Desulfosarcina sp.]|uniref:PocR ligand-binding domain-containing protein n=1 Tax=uncultured Desulfosarcina sp. TaxID=218289 RepID=UPI0029C72D46|nr:PocR ligand-binding domain-containing protein [uncultured Desulfosarcina sp.]
MELLDLCPLETWKTLEDDIRERTGLNAGVFSTEGIRIIPPAVWPNPLCPEIKANPKGQSFICATAHMNIANLAKASREPVIEECDAGMVKLVVPIFSGDEFVGTVSGCGLLLDDGVADTFLVNKITGIEEAALKKLATSIPAISMEKAREISRFIQERVGRIVAAYQATTH